MDWGAFPNLNPESVAVWYQDSPEDTTVKPWDAANNDQWDVFGPVPIPLESSAAGTNLYAALPSIEDLDAGKRFTVRNEGEKFESSWMTEASNGPSLNLTYLSRYGAPVAGEKNLGGNGAAYLARKRFRVRAGVSNVWAYLSHDDPIELELNGKVLYNQTKPMSGFQTRWVILPVRPGENVLVVRLTNYFNQTFNWAGFALWLKDASGRPVRFSGL